MGICACVLTAIQPSHLLEVRQAVFAVFSVALLAVLYSLDRRSIH